jgi:hypothetical protein
LANTRLGNLRDRPGTRLPQIVGTWIAGFLR